MVVVGLVANSRGQGTGSGRAFFGSGALSSGLLGGVATAADQAEAERSSGDGAACNERTAVENDLLSFHDPS